MSRVTIVNDSPEILDVLAEAMAGHEVTRIIGDGSQAIDEVEQSTPDLVMVDLWSGNIALQGWHVAQQLRQRPSMRRTPLLLLSSDAAALEQLASDLGAATRVKTLLAPFSLEELDAAVRACLRSAPRQAPAPSSSRRAAASS